VKAGKAACAGKALLVRGGAPIYSVGCDSSPRNCEPPGRVMLDSTSRNAYRGRSVASSCIALAVVMLNVLFLLGLRVRIEFASQWLSALNEPLLVLVGLVTILCINDGEAPLLGLKLSPVQGWYYWVRVACWFGLAIALLLAVCSGVFLVGGWEIPTPPKPGNFGLALFWMCCYAPLVEELVYRSLLTAAVLPLAGQRGAIIASGILFAAIHIIGGNPGPDNQIAGFLLEWALLRSGTILVPMGMHAAGNLIALALHVAVWS
jgi:membrane protease YdiL (CAAX protease family)